MYYPDEQRYDKMTYRRCGASGLRLPAISLGLWHNFGGVERFENMRAMLRRAFDLGITHFDLANNYGPPPGSAEENFGRALRARSGRMARRTDRLHQGRLPDVARALRRMGIAQIPAGQPGPKPAAGWGSTMSISSTRTAPTRIRRSKRPCRALDSAVRAGKALYAGHFELQPRADRPRGGDLAPDWVRHA